MDCEFTPEAIAGPVRRRRHHLTPARRRTSASLDSLDEDGLPEASEVKDHRNRSGDDNAPKKNNGDNDATKERTAAQHQQQQRRDRGSRRMLRRASGSFMHVGLVRPIPLVERIIMGILVVSSLTLSAFTLAGRHQRKAALYLPHWVPIMAITSINPWLMWNTPKMLRNRRTVLLCILEWIHCLSAMLHHIFEHPLLVTFAGSVFPLWSLWMQLIKEKDYESRSIKGLRSSMSTLSVRSDVKKIDKAALLSVVLYVVQWSIHGHIFVLAGAGPMTVLFPFLRHEMYVEDFVNFAMLGFLFFAENLAIMKGGSSRMGMGGLAQMLHIVSHFAISYTFYCINKKHFFHDGGRQRKFSGSIRETVLS